MTVSGSLDSRVPGATYPSVPTPITFDHLSLIAELVLDLVYQTDLAGVIQWISPSVTQILGWKPEELLGTLSAELVHPDDQPDMRANRIRMDAGELVDDHAVRFRTLAGDYRWMSVRLRPVFDVGGDIVARMIGTHDVHEELTVRKALDTLSKGSAVLIRATSEAELLQSMCETIVRSGRYLIACYQRPLHDAEKSVVPVAEFGDLSGYLTRIKVTWDDSPTGQGPSGTALRTGQIQNSKDVLNDPLTQFWAKEATAVGIRSSIALPVLVDGRIDGTLTVYGSEINEFNEGARALLADLADALGYGLGRLQNQVRSNALIDSLMDPHVLFSPVRNDSGAIVDFTYVDANRAACEYMCISHDQLIGMRLLEILPGHVESGTLARYAEVIESGRPLALDRYPYQNEVRGSVTFADVRAIRVGDMLVLNWRDVTDRYAADVALAASEEQYRLLAENSSDVVLRLNKGVVGWISPSITDMLGWSQNDLLDKHLDELILPEDLNKFLECQLTISHEEHLHVTRFRMLAKDKSYHWVEIRAKRYINASGEWDGAVASFHTIDAQVAAEQSLERRARHDELTGLLNRNDMLDRLSAISSHSLRTGHEIAVMFCDVDAFKSVNDTRGHATGDQVLRTIATRIEGSVRSGDLIARIGGDEFLVILDGVHDLSEAINIAEKLRRRVAKPIHIPDGPITTTLSIGVTLAKPGENVDGLVARADRAMYKAKESGSDQVVALSD